MPSDDQRVRDEASADELDVLPPYTVVSYGVDFDVAGLVQRLDNDDIRIPQFQREFVWSFRQAARFVESLLLGLPVPGIFLWREPVTERLVVVDGLQRLRSLQYFYHGAIRGREFTLPLQTSPYQIVHHSFQGRGYRDLEDEDRRRLDNSIIHATVVIQERPPEDDSSIYYLFERINTEGTELVPQEIRAAIYRGSLLDLLADLNDDPHWRAVFGSKSLRMKDQELILRFLAMYQDAEHYARPMKEFLNFYVRSHRDPSADQLQYLSDTFHRSIQTIHEAVGRQAFRPGGRALNAAVFDAVMVGITRRLRAGPPIDPPTVAARYEALLAQPEFQDAYTRATADTESVRRRLDLATEAFAR